MQKMSEQEAIEIHIAENIHRIEVIENFMYKVPDADKEKCRKNISVLSKINGLLQEIQQYRAIGTVEECRKALERMKPKSPTYDGDGYAPDGTFVWDEWLCPNCGSRYEVDFDEYDHCPNCGQAILREEAEAALERMQNGINEYIDRILEGEEHE